MAFSISPSTPLKLVSSSTTDVSPPVHPDSPNSDPSLLRQLTEAPHLSCGQSGLCRALPPPWLAIQLVPQIHRSSKRNWDRHMPHYWSSLMSFDMSTTPLQTLSLNHLLVGWKRSCHSGASSPALTATHCCWHTLVTHSTVLTHTHTHMLASYRQNTSLILAPPCRWPLALNWNCDTGSGLLARSRDLLSVEQVLA